MPEHQIRFENGAAYERMMGGWTRLAGAVFLDWLAPGTGLHWLDVGCGNGAFTELLCERTAPAEVHGIDPSEAQLAFARTRPAGRIAHFQLGNAMALPFPAQRFDAAVMALVIFFVPEPAKGVAEMVRVVRPGGTVAAYAWDMLGGGFPGEPIQAELRAMGLKPLLPPSAEASRTAALRALWAEAGLDAIDTREITVTRSFADFDEFWAISTSSSAMASVLHLMSAGDIDQVKARVRARLPANGAGGVAYPSRANAITGRVPT